MQAAHLPHHLVGGAQVQVVGVGKLHLAANVFQVSGAECALDGTLGTDIHKNGSLNHTVGAGKYTPAGFPFCFFQLKHSYSIFNVYFAVLEFVYCRNYARRRSHTNSPAKRQYLRIHAADLDKHKVPSLPQQKHFCLV